MELNSQLLAMKQKINAAEKQMDTLLQGTQSPQKANTLLDAAMQKMEVTCIQLRRLCEEIRPQVPEKFVCTTPHVSKNIYGEVCREYAGWLHIKLNTLLPHYKILGGTQYITDSITRLLNQYDAQGGQLPMFEKAFLAIVEHCPVECSEAFDHDNKGFKAIQNALKGRLFPDDNQFELSLGLFTVLDTENCCHIYVLPDEEAAEFMDLRLSELV